ncbi:MAG: hypothetical protein ACJA2W_000058 [Planctomycetota bacterium]|jgi:hypothetical protein
MEVIGTAMCVVDRTPNHASGHRIPIDVPENAPLSIHGPNRLRPVPGLEERTIPPVPRIEEQHIVSKHVSHGEIQFTGRRLQEQVVVVGHQHVRKDHNPPQHHLLLQHLKKRCPIDAILKDGPPRNTTPIDVVPLLRKILS